MKATAQILGTLLCLAFLTGCERATEGLQYAKNRDGSDDKSILIGYNGNDTDVVIPDSVELINGGTFYDKQLTSVVIPKSVTIIGRQAFEKNKLTNVVIPDSVTSIGERAFAKNNLTSVTIPDSVTFIGERAFNKNAISIVNNVPSDGIIFARNDDGTENKKIIISYGGARKEIAIPDSVIT
ncbi:leucine-rich repeat domain-containing protein, partial [Vibrio sp. Vb2362]|nr:leucine-rich repeat domain-containing protein [Vibrio sp. Vb2362]